jgi:ribosome maturation factor RimP
MGQVSLARIREIAERVAASEGLEVVEVELRGKGRGSLLRVFIDKPGGVTHGDCELVSRQMSAILDVEDPIESSYVLEVSSPGLERRLHKPADYDRFAGHQVRLILKQAQDGRRQVAGRLEGLENGLVRVGVEGGETLAVRHENIERANLVFEWK